jgi:TIR domain
VSSSDKPSSNGAKIFVSYSRGDVAFADQLVAALESFGYRAVIDRHDTSGGEDWKKRLGNLILTADTVVFVMSPASAVSEICQWEVAETDRLGKRLIPIICAPLGETKPPERLQGVNYIYFGAVPEDLLP